MPHGPLGHHKVEPVPVNHLAQMVARLGLNIKTAARLANLHPGVVHKLLEDPPKSSMLNGYIRLYEAIGASLRLRSAPEVSIWLNRQHLRDLYFNDAVRKGMELPAHPKTRGDLRLEVRRLYRKKMSYKDILDHMTAGYICTGEGLDNWRKSVIGQVVNSKPVTASKARPIAPQEPMLEKWEDMLIQRLFLDCATADPAYRIRYGFKTIKQADRVWLVSESGEQCPMTVKVREWFLDDVRRIPWLAGAWGEEAMAVSE